MLEIFVLAIVQGITEFLPVSSSGHLAVGGAIFDTLERVVEEKLTVSIVLHVGTLLSILVFFRQRIIALLGEDRRVIGLILVGSIPAGIIGVGLKRFLPGSEVFLASALLSGFMFLVTGSLLIWGNRHPTSTGICRHLSFKAALLIGGFQALAILPGVSRSGATITAGLAMRLRRDEAATFSFLLAIPAMAGAGFLEALELLEDTPETASLAALGVGLVVSFLVGLMALAWLIRWLREGHLHWFALWVFPLGVVVILWQLGSRLMS